MLVPAKRKAFTKLDKELGHFRRYEKKELVRKLEEAGYKVSHIKFFNAVGLFTWVMRNYLSGQKIQLSSKQIALFDLLVPILKRIERLAPMPIGISLVVIAKNEN